MKLPKVLAAPASAALLIACVSGLTACASTSGESSGGVAATVNGVEIQEQTVTDYVQEFRDSQGVAEDDAWGTWMATYGMNPSSVREEVINYFVDEELVKQAAEENDVTVSDDEVQEQIDQMKANYGSDEAWESALSSAGTTEEKYRETLRNAMLESKLQETVATDAAEPSDEEIVDYVRSYAPALDGAKRSSHILFNSDDQETAQKVLDQINSGEIAFEDAVEQYSSDTASAEHGGDVGWDSLNSFVSEYTEALANLEKDQVSDLVTSQYGIHIIKCTDIFTVPDEITSVDQVPTEFVDYIKDMLASSGQSNAFSQWKETYKESAEIVINDMPEGLPYDIDMTAYQTEADDESADAETTAEGETTEGPEADDGATAEEGAAADGEAAQDGAAPDAEATADGATSQDTTALVQ